MAPGALLALLVHGGLLLALTAVVDWRTHTTEVVSAELWASVPQIAAPKSVEPPAPEVKPEPRVEPKPEPKPEVKPEPARPTDAQIATEKAERQRAERERLLEEERKEKAERDKKRQEEARLAKQREENVKRMLGQLGTGDNPNGTAPRDAAPSSSYTGRLIARIKPNIVFTDTVPGNPAAEVEVRSAPTGTIIARRIVTSSGFKEWDEAVLRAIDRTGTLPRDTDGRVPATITITFRPRELAP